MFKENEDNSDDQDILEKLSRFIMILSNNYYKEVGCIFGIVIIQSFYEVANIIGFLNEDLSSHKIQSKVNIINEVSGREPSLPSLSLRNKLGGYYFGDGYIFILNSDSESCNILVVGSIVRVSLSLYYS